MVRCPLYYSTEFASKSFEFRIVKMSQSGSNCCSLILILAILQSIIQEKKTTDGIMVKLYELYPLLCNIMRHCPDTLIEPISHVLLAYHPFLSSPWNVLLAIFTLARKSTKKPFTGWKLLSPLFKYEVFSYLLKNIWAFLKFVVLTSEEKFRPHLKLSL